MSGKTLRAKFIANEVTDYGAQYPGSVNKRVKLSAVYSHDRNTEDNQFSSATPSGNMEMVISNPNADGFFQPGKKYYLDITEAPD